MNLLGRISACGEMTSGFLRVRDGGKRWLRAGPVEAPVAKNKKVA